MAIARLDVRVWKLVSCVVRQSENGEDAVEAASQMRRGLLRDVHLVLYNFV